MKNKKKQIVVMILLVLSLILVTVGVTYAFFRYAKEGSTENTLTTGTIEFLYTEVDKVGAGISIENAFPISDSKGKLLTGTGNIFNFKITSKVSGDMDIPYTVTAKTKDGSELDPKVVRLYLTDTTGDVEKELLLDNYNNLDSYNNNIEEKIIYEGLVPTGSTNYEKTFALRMWVASDADFSDGSLNGKTFTITVNVYSNAKVVTEEEIDMANTTEINNLSLNNSEVEEIEGLEYDYEEVLPEGTTNVSLDIETLSPDAQVSVEKVDSVAYNTSSIKKLSTKKTLDLNNGDNYFKIKVTNANKTETKEYTLKLTVGYSTLSKTIDEVINKFDSSTLKESIMCNMIENGSNTYYHRCKVYDTVDSAIDSRNKGIVILTSENLSTTTFNPTKDVVINLNNNTYNSILCNTSMPTIDNNELTFNSNNECSIHNDLIVANNYNNDNYNEGYILMLDNYETDSQITIKKNLTFDINGKEIKCTNNELTSFISPWKDLTLLDNKKTGTIINEYMDTVGSNAKNVTINSNVNIKSGRSAIRTYSAATNTTVNVTSGDIECENVSNHGCVHVSNDTSTINVNNADILSTGPGVYTKQGIINIYGGKIVSANDHSVFNGNKLNITNGTFESNYGMWVGDNATVYISGGNINDDIAVGTSENVNIYISGGTFLDQNNISLTTNSNGNVYICGGTFNLNDYNNNYNIYLHTQNSHIYYKSSGINWNNGQGLKFNTNYPENIIIDDTITCTK